VFVADEILVPASFADTRSRLAELAHCGTLASASDSAFGDGLACLIRVGPPHLTRLVDVRFRELVIRADSAVLTLRWEATGPSGRLFPALDADITLTPAGEHATRLSLAGAYRPPLAALGAGLDKAIFHRVASATIRSFLSRAAAALTHPQAAVQDGPLISPAQPAPHPAAPDEA
jgi:hypothetical protein